MTNDNVLILYNDDAENRPKETKLFRPHCEKTVTNTAKTMAITFGLPKQAESFRNLHDNNPFTHVFSHSRIQKVKEFFSGALIAAYSIHLEDWYHQAFDKIEISATQDQDSFIETILEQFKQLLIQDNHQKLAKYCLTIFARQLEWYESEFTEYLKQKFPSLDQIYPENISVIDFFKSLPSHQIETIKSKAAASQYEKMIGNSPGMLQLSDEIIRVAKSNMSLLIYGETGVGKELVAKEVHRNSERMSKVFIPINCAALPKDTQESELFGHEKAAFTGADDLHRGFFEQANHGTLFLDEIGELSLSAQAKFLRVLQDGSFRRMKGSEDMKIDVRIVAATNRNLEKMIQENEFRQDLFHRLDRLRITVPPLRDRKVDIPILAEHFLECSRKDTGREIKGFTPEAMRLLRDYHWPGNVRELENIIGKAAVMGNDSVIQESDIVFSPLRTVDEPNGHSVSRSEFQENLISHLQASGMDENQARKEGFNLVSDLGKHEDAFNQEPNQLRRSWDKAAKYLGKGASAISQKRNRMVKQICNLNLPKEILKDLFDLFPATTDGWNEYFSKETDAS